MKSRTFDPSAAFVISITLLILFGMLFGWGTHAQTEPPITTIDATDAGTTNGQGTWATAINAAGVIGGYFLDTNFGCHAFVRRPDGTFTSFDGPTGCPIPANINQRSVVTGTYADRSFGCSAGQPDNPPGCGGFHAFTHCRIIWLPCRTAETSICIGSRDHTSLVNARGYQVTGLRAAGAIGPGIESGGDKPRRSS